MRIKGTFLDEISHDIPHQNWGEAEWDRDFGYMREAGIDTVILIRCGYRRFSLAGAHGRGGVLRTARRSGRYVPAPERQVGHELLVRALRFGQVLGPRRIRAGGGAEQTRDRRGVEPLRTLQILCGLVYFAGMQPQYRQDRRSVCESGTLLQGGFRRSADYDFPLYRRQQERQPVQCFDFEAERRDARKP